MKTTKRNATGLMLILLIVLCLMDDGSTLLAASVSEINFQSLKSVVLDLATEFPDQYTRRETYLQEIAAYEKAYPDIVAGVQQGQPDAIQRFEEVLAWKRRLLLDNPLLDFDHLLVIRRKPLDDPRRVTGDAENDKGLGKFLGIPQQSSWQLHTMPEVTGWENDIAVLSDLRHIVSLKSLYRPKGGALVNEMDLHFDAEHLMFSQPDANKKWQIYEINIDGTALKQLSPRDQTDVHNLDSCYLPNDKIAYISTAPFQGVPCNASVNVGMMYSMDRSGKNIRQLCFDQDHNYCPTVMPDGRILYLRWEYTDIPHVWARYLFTMNPDGTGQREYYGSGGYWPNSIFFARPIPGHPTKVAGIVTGHHVGRVGELIVLDPARGRNATRGVVQRIPSRGQTVQPLIQDKLALNSWPKCLHPWPLSEKYFLVSCKPTPNALWGIYLVDTFDNIQLIKEVEGYALLEPIPIQKMPRPAVIPDRVDLTRQDAIVYIEDLYKGPGLTDVPRGTVEKLRLFTYHFAYRKVAGINHRVGADGPWEPKRVLGTVPVETDGSAMFRVPANTPISIQPIDSQGNALQLMRSWMTAMPGEIVSCVGCHEKQNAIPLTQKTIAANQAPAEITPWKGPVRGFSFAREVQPVLDTYCISCHNEDTHRVHANVPDLRGDQGKFAVVKNSDPRVIYASDTSREELFGKYGGIFEPSYIELRRLVRVGGFESDIRALAPGEFHTNTSELFQMLKKGHHGVTLNADAWERLATWIDLNAPCHGTWGDIVGAEKTKNDRRRRQELQVLYAGIHEDPEMVEETVRSPIQPVAPATVSRPDFDRPVVAHWPLEDAQARLKQGHAGATHRSIDLGQGVTLELTRIPTGSFVMGDTSGAPDEMPPAAVSVETPFWMGQFEITNEQYARFDGAHDSRFEHKGSWVFSEGHLGWPLNRPKQPVVRVSWDEAVAFCEWLSDRTGQTVTLPTESQWEWACRAGTDTSMFFGDLDSDFSAYANMADATIRQMAYDTDGRYTMDLTPREPRYNDRHLVTAKVGTYQPNPWGLYDMHGNVGEWTRSVYKPYPYRAGDGRNDLGSDGSRVVRGGSWRDRPKRCTSAYRLNYPKEQKVFNVGFRIVIQDGTARSSKTAAL